MSVGGDLYESLCSAIESGVGITRSPVPFSALEVPAHLTEHTFMLRPDGVVSTGGDGSGKAVRTWSYTVLVTCRMAQNPTAGVTTAMNIAEGIVAVLHDDPIGGARIDVGDEIFDYPADGHHVVLSLPFTAVLWTAQD